MKYIIIGTACLMVIGVIAGTFFFEKESNVRQPNTPVISDTGPPPLQSVNETDPVGYSLQQDQLQITYNNVENEKGSRDRFDDYGCLYSFLFLRLCLCRRALTRA
ncbi:hypothetical protein JI667_14180 [Bacillus sp. NTK074B]|uniref:hypothetical protein n=1 Tax=Bacillus sp. NTK074B TaxID=2802174 RepID=UPI001A8C5015|nr:hypothetical protein [Bacillus sp. NTK074B]